MSLHPNFPVSPYAPLIPEQRWFPADETLRSTAYEKLLPPLVAKIRQEVHAWRGKGYAGASQTSVALLRWWFENDHLLENADGSLSAFRYYFAQREAVETVIWLHDVRHARDKFDLLRFDASGAVSCGMFSEDWPRYVLKMATGAGKTKVISLLIAWSFFHKLYESDSELSRNFLVIAPNIIVLDRLRADNLGGRLTGKKKEQALARKEQEFRDLILKAYRAEPLPDTAFFHGKNSGRLVVVGPINLPVGRLFVEEVITECRKRGASRVDVLAFEFEMGLFPAVLDEAKHKGIDLAPKTIPPEVFDKRAVEKGQVRFHDVAYIEVAPRYDAQNALVVSVELTDFSVYYSQGLADAIAADLKEGKSEVVCEQGKLLKVSKDKQGIIIRDVLTKKWTDWVDYWAVDFDYESRKEIIKVAKTMGVEGELPGVVVAGEELLEFEERWTGAYIFENEWQSFRTRQNRDLELRSGVHTYARAGRYTVAVKVIDIFGNDTMSLVGVNVG